MSLFRLKKKKKKKKKTDSIKVIPYLPKFIFPRPNQTCNYDV